MPMCAQNADKAGAGSGFVKPPAGCSALGTWKKLTSHMVARSRARWWATSTCRVFEGSRLQQRGGRRAISGSPRARLSLGQPASKFGQRVSLVAAKACNGTERISTVRVMDRLQLWAMNVNVVFKYMEMIVTFLLLGFTPSHRSGGGSGVGGDTMDGTAACSSGAAGTSRPVERASHRGDGLQPPAMGAAPSHRCAGGGYRPRLRRPLVAQPVGATSRGRTNDGNCMGPTGRMVL